jgi:hypothetical protein
LRLHHLLVPLAWKQVQHQLLLEWSSLAFSSLNCDSNIHKHAMNRNHPSNNTLRMTQHDLQSLSPHCNLLSVSLSWPYVLSRRSRDLVICDLLWRRR